MSVHHQIWTNVPKTSMPSFKITFIIYRRRFNAKSEASQKKKEENIDWDPSAFIFVTLTSYSKFATSIVGAKKAWNRWRKNTHEKTGLQAAILVGGAIRHRSTCACAGSAGCCAIGQTSPRDMIINYRRWSYGRVKRHPPKKNYFHPIHPKINDHEFVFDEPAAVRGPEVPTERGVLAGELHAGLLQSAPSTTLRWISCVCSRKWNCRLCKHIASWLL